MQAARVHYDFDRQRQYPRYRIPAQCTVLGMPYPILDWSVGGCAVSGFDRVADNDQPLLVHLAFPVAGVELSVPLEARIVSHDHSSGRTGFKFMAINARQATLMQRIADASLTGSLANFDSLDPGSSPTGTAVGRPLKFSIVTAIRHAPTRFLGMTAVFAIGLFAGWMGLRALYGNLFLERAVASSLVGDSILVAAPTSGHIDFVVADKTVANGQMVASVIDAQEKSISIDSVCDCVVTYRNGLVGNFINRGDPLVRMIRRDSPMQITAAFSQDALRVVGNAVTVRIAYGDGVVHWRPLQELEPRIVKTSGTQESNATVEMTFKSTRSDLTVENDGQPVSVIIDTAPVPLVGRLLGLVG